MSQGPCAYTLQELALVRRAISRLRFLSPVEVQIAAEAVAVGRCPDQLAPFWTLASTHPSLFHRLAKDALLETCSFYAFFPGTYELVSRPGRLPQVTFTGRTPGTVAIFQWGTHGLVVKPLQSRREGEIARLAGVLEVGPRQHPSLPGFLTEEFVDGPFFTDLPPEETTADRMYQLGRDLGGMLARLHAHRICYNDATLSDPAGRSHLLLPQVGKPRLIDFGVSVLLDRHPQLGQDEVYNLARTLPMFRLFASMGAGAPELGQFLGEYRQSLGRTPWQELLGRDLRFMEEGLQLAARRLGDHVAAPFRRGFGEAYR